MIYSRIQKFISSFVLFSLLFGITFRVPFVDFSTYAGSSDFFNLVSIIVDEDTYDEIDFELERYSKDIQGVLENTKVVILPTPKNASAFSIASMNESLYFEGYKGLVKDTYFESKLIGTVIVGDFNLPVVNIENESAKTILPFTDFEDKEYIYNNEINKYEKNKKNSDGLKSEIWHGVISPNLGDKDLNIEALKNYFDKNHDYYSGTGNFKYSEGIINGNKSLGVANSYNPFVFYYDQFREEKSLNYNSYKGYEAYLENKEDIIYNRFNKELSDKVTDKVLGNSNDEIQGLADNILERNETMGDDFPFSAFDSDFVDQLKGVGPDLSQAPDIQTRHVINNVTKRFLEIFAKGTIGEFRSNVHNAGRYNETGSEVNVDLIPYIVTVLDSVNDEIVKDVNEELENKIDDLVKNGLSRKIAVPTLIKDKNNSSCNDTYENYLFGTKASSINSASECSIYRGSTNEGGTLVEANRGLNVNLAINDKDTLGSEPDSVYCYKNLESGDSLKGWWGGNSSLNLNRAEATSGNLQLRDHDLKGSITKLFDIGGSTKITDNSKIYSPSNCYDNNYLLAENKEWVTTGFGDDSSVTCEPVYRLPTYGTRENWSCTTDNNSGEKIYDFSQSFESNFKTLDSAQCEINNIYIGDNLVKTEQYTDICEGGGDDGCSYLCSGVNITTNSDGSITEYAYNNWVGYDYSYKTIPSFIEHKSPNAYELKEEIKAILTKSLPIDQVRYIDFMSAIGVQEKIEYPSLFQIDSTDEGTISIESISEELVSSLNAKSAEINNIIRNNNPGSLSGDNQEIYNLLKTGTYPAADFDLVEILKSKEDKTLTILNESKTISYFDSLVFSIYWNSLTSISAKYAFVFDNYLTDQFGFEDNKYFLPKNKKQYEIAYLGAEGDAQNMYIKLDPEGKAENPYSDILSDNINLSSLLLGANLGSSTSDAGVFKCAPPDGVPIWEWIPAVMCRLGEMMPPSISLSDGTCGPSLLSIEEQEEIKECNGDVNKNGVNDCIEQKLGDDGSLELSSDSLKYFFNKHSELSATIKDKNGKTVKLANDTNIHFELVKIEEADDKSKDLLKGNTKTVYDIDSTYYNDESVISDYVTFKNQKVRAQGGVAKYGLGLKSKESNIFVRAYIKIDDFFEEEVIFLESDLLEIKIRGDRLFNSSYKLINSATGVDIDAGINSLKVSDKSNIYLIDGTKQSITDISKIISNSSTSEEKIVLFIENLSKAGNKIDISYPLTVTLSDGNNEVHKLKIEKNELKSFKSILSIKKSGSYKISIKDALGFTTVKNIELLPEVPNSVDIQLGTTIMQTGGNISTNFITIYDKYFNPTVGNFYDLEFSIDGNGIEFLDNSSDELNTNTFEGYKIFRLKSTSSDGDNKIRVVVKDDLGNNLTDNSKSIETIDDINLIAKPLSGNIKVGGNSYKYEVSLRGTDGKVLSDFNSRVYLVSDSIFLETVNPYVELKNGIAVVEFRTKTLAGKNIPVEFQVEGLKEIVEKEITVLPDDAMKIDLILSKNNIEASTDSSSTLIVELKDRYNNLVFNDNTTETTLEILDNYSHVITSDINSSKVTDGKTSYKIYGTVNPGVAYFKVGTNPSLNINSFIITDENGEVEVNGVGENALKIETFYFWNKDKLEGKKYNGLYTTLLGSNYGDITEENYLAGSLLFEKNNRSLAVTSLLNNSFKYSNILDLSKNGGLKTIYPESDLSQDIEINPIFNDSKLNLSLYNKSLNIYLGKVFYNFDEAKLLSCELSNAGCIDENESSIYLKSHSNNYNVYLDNDKLLLRDIYGKNLIEISEDGTINRFGTIDFEVNKNNNENNLVVDIKTGGILIASIGYNIIDGITNVSRNEDIFNSKVGSVKNSILVYLNTNSYGAYSSSNTDDKSTVFYYNDPFASNSSLDSFSRSNNDGYENFINAGGLGWSGGNKSLLAFSAGKSVGNSVKDYMSFSIINLGDPVLKIKKITEKLPGTNINRKFDSSIGKLLTTDEGIAGYRTFDYDNDNKKDILLIKSDNYLKLLENKDIDGGLLKKGNIAYIVDLASEDLIETGDFTGDGYDDIFFVNKEGNPYLLNNISKDFSRYSLIENFKLDGRIVRAETFDMDNDSITDIVTLDDAGQINIFYGGGTSVKPSFTKLTLSEDNGIKLNSEVRNDNSIIYFDGLYQPASVGNDNKRVDNLLFERYPYSTDKSEIDYEGILNGTKDLPLERDSIYFLKSEYSEHSGMKVEKIFKDLNGGFISSGDMINVEIRLTNVSNGRLKNVVFGEKVPDVFTIDKSSIDSDIDYNIGDGELGYKFLIDNFDLNWNESVTITYDAKVKPLKYSYLEVGLFEKDEVGDDFYGDVIIKDNNKNCSNPVDLFRSLNIRSYQRGTKDPTCDESKVELPEELERNTHDANDNGIPDYIDKLTDSSDLTAITDYAKEELAKMNIDSDFDGIPDSEDNFNMDGSITIDLGSAGAKIDSALDNVQEILNGLSCGFGDASCFASPLNWAPLAPGSDPVFMGKLIGDGLKIDEGYPIVSALTGMEIFVPACVPIPVIWPVSSYALETTCTLNIDGAGGELGIYSPANFFRLFVTPTLTGGIGTAICFGGPAAVAGRSVPKAISPLVPGGNCIVVAKKFLGCGGDGSDGDPSSVGITNYYGDGSFGIINGNCGTGEESYNNILSTSSVSSYLNGSSDGVVSGIFDFLPGVFSDNNIKPIFTKGNGGDASVSVDFSALENGNFEDIIQIKQTRITAFPSWLMDWVTRQIEEIVNKLTDFPTVFVILPDFSGVFDGDWINTSGNNDTIDEDAFAIDKNLTNNETAKEITQTVNSGIKEAYEFIGSTPLVYIEQETVDITIPWISITEINKAEAMIDGTIKQWEGEIQKAREAWSFGTQCNYKEAKKQAKCIEDNNFSSKVSADVMVDLDATLGKLRANLEAIKSYKEIPEKINKLITKKEDYLEQILCNIDIISSILGGRIGKNGDRFKTWVELYILIKAILKSWQLMVDVFIDYEEECHECKNERQDALEEEFSLIDAIIPQIPIITFPKWPDIIIDLHNIRAGLTVALPEFKVTTKPIIIPSLPKLYLPEVPSIDLQLNLNLDGILDIPVLPTLEIPELPDLPTLPTIELPDLPPPPKLPKMLGSIEAVLDIIKLITKAMCILKSSPLHPEWRAGDQIAFLTERSGYLGSDFFEVSMPQFSFPFLDAITVTTYVNLEFESDFIVELAKQIAMPINNFTNDFTSIFNFKFEDFDLRDIVPTDAIPSSIEINVGKDGVSGNIQEKLKEVLADRVVTNITHLSSVLKEGQNKLVSNLEFKQIINKSLASKTVTSNPKMEKLLGVWNEVNNLTYSKEDKLINDLMSSSRAKFKALTDIVNTEIINNKEFKRKIQNIGETPIITKVSSGDSNKIKGYNDSLTIYNDQFKESAKKLIQGNSSKEIKNDLKNSGETLVESIKTPLEKYNSANKSTKSNLIAATTTVNSDTAEANSCQGQAKSDYGYNYEGLYVIEGNKSYRLFDYLGELNGNEVTEIIDIDKDGDEDLLYFTNNNLYLKENLENKDTKIYLSTNPLVLNSSDNKFLNGDIFYEAINNAYELGNDNGNLNIGFTAPTNSTINNFRVGFYTIIDKYLNSNNSSYKPEFIKKDIIDAVAGINEVTKVSEGNLYVKRNNVSYINNVGNLKGVQLKTKELFDIQDNISSNTSVNIVKGTSLYAGGNVFEIEYIISNGNNVETLSVAKYQNIELLQDIKIIGISGSAYIEGNNDIIYEGIDIRSYLEKPLFPGSKISYEGNNYELLNQTYVELSYYDGSELNLDFDNDNSWELYDLGDKTNDYYLRIEKDNDYYYSKINSFKDNIEGTISKQILLAPQIQSDTNSPILNMPSIRIPVYQKQQVDLTSYIYENSGINNISKVIVDLDLENDTNGNGNSKDDNDGILEGEFKDKVKVLHSLISLKLEFGEFDKFFKKKIGITLIDINDNKGYSEVELEVYTPTPQITNYDGGLINGTINEGLTDEPVNIYRYRGGIITKLDNTEGLNKTLTDDGNYSFDVSAEGTGLKLFKAEEEIAFINEKTGNIDLKDFSLNIKVLSSNDKFNDKPFPKIIIQNSGEDLFYEYLQMEGINKVNVVNDFENLTEKGIYFSFTNSSNYNFYTLPENIDFNPGSLSVYRLSDLNKSELFTIFKDGRINTLNSFYKLEYIENEEYITLKLVDSHFNREIGRILFISDSEYIMK